MTEKTLTVKRAAKTNRPVRKRAADPTVMTYRALMPIQVGTESGVEPRVFGDFVPEVLGWKSPGIWLQTKRIEQVFVNQSEIDAWRRRYDKRLTAERAAKKAAEDEDAEIARLQAELRAAQAKKQAQAAPDFNAAPTSREFAPDKTKQEPIPYVDLGAVKFNTTRAPQASQSVSENRSRPTTVRRVVRKKV